MVRFHRRYIPFPSSRIAPNPNRNSWHDPVYDRTARWEMSTLEVGIGFESIKTPAIIVIIFARFSSMGFQITSRMAAALY